MYKSKFYKNVTKTTNKVGKYKIKSYSNSIKRKVRRLNNFIMKLIL